MNKQLLLLKELMPDQAVLDLIAQERERQTNTIPLIASENFCSPAVRQALASEFVNKYAEGRPGQRYYAGNQFADKLETLTENRALDLFVPEPSRPDWRANVQPLSGTAANLAVLTALLHPGDRLLAMNLSAGGHLSHGHPANLSGQLYEIHEYGVDRESCQLDYEAIAKQAQTVKPKLIIAGASAYPREIDFARFAAIAKSVNALLLADVSHIAGLIAGKTHPSPIPHADVVTLTTHKTLRGPRAAIILCRESLAKQINRGVFPGVQGGPHLNQIAAVAVALQEAAHQDFSDYTQAIVANARALADELQRLGWPIVTGGTDNHLLLVDLSKSGLNGRAAQQTLESIGVITNANRIPFDTGTAQEPAGLRLGTAAITTLGATEAWCRDLAKIIDTALRDGASTELTSAVKQARRLL